MPPQKFWKVFWKIIFDVVGGQVILKEELTLWDNIHPASVDPPVRLDRTVKDLTCEPIGEVQIENDHAVFAGGYIKATSFDKQAYVDELQQAGIVTSVGPPTLDGITAIVGETVAIRADVWLEPASRSPIFHYPQPDLNPGVELSRYYNEKEDYYTLAWSISGNPLPRGNSYRSHGYQLDDADGWHRLRVRQGEENGAPVFDFTVDSIPLGSRVVEATVKQIVPVLPGVHLFEPAAQTFYIGATPGHLQQFGEGLHGKIRHLEFDPNDSCGSCRGG
jgi:hypothetical protein